MQANVLTLIVVILAFGCSYSKPQSTSTINANTTMSDTTKPNTNAGVKTDAEWKKELSAEQYRVLREKGTERAFTGEHDQNWEAGTYVCAGCNIALFTSDTKFDAGCGWPSFYKGIDKSKIKEIVDSSYGMTRTEVVCANCGGHLGHVFNDGPEPSGLRYCINSVSLGFKKKE